MISAVQQIATGTEDWKSEFIKFVSCKMDEILEDYKMDSITDISKSLFQNRSEIMGKAALALIEQKYENLINQEYCACPLCNRSIKAQAEKVRREIDTLVGPVTLYRPYFYCKACGYGFYPLDDALGLSKRRVQFVYILLIIKK